MDTIRPEWSSIPWSRICLGGGILGGQDWGKVDESATVAAVRTAHDAGVTVFDTADVYGLGRAEERLARALGSSISEVAVVTKGGVAWRRDGPDRAVTWRDLSPEHLRDAVRESLRRLGLECIPVYLAHWPDGDHSVEDVVATLDGLRQEGLVHRIGLSNFSVDDLRRPGVLQAIDVIQVGHNLLNDGRETIDLAASAGIPVMLYGALGQGLLSAKYSREHAFPPDDHRHRLSHFAKRSAGQDRLLAELRAVATEAGVSPAQAAIRWVLDTAPTGCAIVGARTPEQARENAAAGETRLSAEHLTRLSAAAELRAET